MRSLILAGAASALLTLSGCASVQMGDPGKSAELKKFQSKAEVAQIYICRNDRAIGGGVRPDLELDGKPLARIARSTYAYAEVKPGEHLLVSKTLEHDSKLPFRIAAGEQKFFQSWISLGFVAGWGILDEVDAAKGRECVAEGDLVESASL